MAATQKKVRSTSVRRQILVADDEIVNLNLLNAMLEDEYDVLLAGNGAEALELIKANRDTLSMMILDIMMPVMSGIDVLREVKADDELARIPVIVATSDKEAELECLNLGAIDFVAKPYPNPEVVNARVKRIIELSEDRDIIQSTERDLLTGVYNKEYFFRYAEQYDQHNPDTPTDAVIIDINHFHMINERYGKAYGDGILKKLGLILLDKVHDTEGIVCRREADTFMVYCPHRDDYAAIMEEAAASMSDDASGNRARLRMGIYSEVDKAVDVEQRFDRAKMAADTVKDNYVRNIAYYDKQLHERQLYAEQLIEDFPAAIAENQFKVYYQPKFDIRPDTPVLESAEALVRWIHPELGMISPGVFIPLFEDNGLIQTLDNYVWREAARQIREWKEKFSYSVPVSVNVSRIDMFDSGLPDVLQGILRENGLTGQDLLVEVTESAYTQDQGQIISMVETLRNQGFRIEMDDFGTGYSSLHMLSTLPIDALKLDMQFIRNAFAVGGNTHMLEVIIGIADYLSVPVIAEGVETEDQMHALKILGCDIVQGYFFSKPVPAGEFEAFILQRKEAALAEADRSACKIRSGSNAENVLKRAKLHAMQNEGVETEDEEEPEETAHEEKSGFHLRTTLVICSVIALIAAAALLITDISVTRGYQRMKDASDRYIESQMAASDMETVSDYLTDRVRCFVVTGEVQYLQDFVEEVEVDKRRDKAVENLTELLQGTDDDAIASLNAALKLSNELVVTENTAMKLITEAGNYDPSDIPDDVASIILSDDDKALSRADKRAKAETLVFDNNYMHHKDKIRENVRSCTESLIRSSSRELEQASARLALLANIQTVLTVVFLLIVLVIVALVSVMIRRPLSNMVEMMQEQRVIPPAGFEELRFVTRTYNRILQENQTSREKLSHEASHDALTGLFNRGAYDLWMESADAEHMALILIDVDYFKSVNDTYGHAVGDRVLKRVADILRGNFRSVDVLCRIGGDEFAVIMTRVNSSMRQLVYNKICRANELLQHPTDDLPPVSLSVGVAFSDRENPQGDIFTDADAALYRVKEAGRKGCQIY